MPLREFICDDGHVTEKILNGEADRTTTAISCPETMEFYTEYDEEPLTMTCGAYAKRVEFSTPAPAQFVEGSGGFYKPSVGATPFTTHNKSSINEFIKENKITKGLTQQAKRALRGS